MARMATEYVFAQTPHGDLSLDLYLPSDRDRAADGPAPPLVIWIHGGGWRSESRAKPPIRRLVDEGFALASISYRFTDRAIFPAQLHDCKAAVRWLRAHAGDLGIDAQRVGVTGCSSGGHLALMLGVTSGMPEFEGNVGDLPLVDSSVQSVVDYYGPTDFVLRGKTQPEIAYTERSGSYALLGGIEYGAVDPDLERLASPAFHVATHAPPLLVFHGEEDRFVLPDQSERIVDAYGKVGASATLVSVAGAGHGGPEFYWGQHFQTMRNFLEQHLLH